MPRRSTGRVTLQHVADQVGVTKITVSRALRQPERVSEALRQRIHAAVDALGYIPNRQAGALSSGRSHSVALLVPSISNAVFSDVQRGIDEGLKAAGYQVLIGHTGYSVREEERLIDTYLAYGVDGFILSGTHHTEHARHLLVRSGLPVVETMEATASPIDMAVGLDQHAAGADLTRSLIEQGYQRIGFCAARLDPRVRQRMAGWKQAMQDAGLSSQRCLTTPQPSSFRLGGTLLAAMLDQWPALDALFCCNDDLAAGALFECQRRGLAVPGQLALAGFNGLDITEATHPTLSTVITPRRDIGEHAAALMLARLRGETPENRSLNLRYTIARRASS
ncbi:HTH-type transcriptional regulator GntR [Halomonas sp. WWR20]